LVAASVSRVLAFAVLFAVGAVVTPARATDGTWLGNNSQWTNPVNWTSNPVVPDNTATFTFLPLVLGVVIDSAVSIQTVQFDPVAVPYTFFLCLSQNVT
jgi:hypothetical protein